MEESVSIDSEKQKQFVKSIKGIKKLIKKGKDPVPSLKEKINKDKKKKKSRSTNVRGLVYLSHIPHGFYENEMTQYFKQFGRVSNVRVIRSPKTGMSRGCAFVEFSEPAVAQIVAETMNNYLMGKRLIKAALVPPEKQRRKALRKNWNQTSNPGNDYRIKMKKAYNSHKTDSEELLKAKKLLKNLAQTKKKLSEIGINYDFFSPVDVPEELADRVVDAKDSGNTEKPDKKQKKQKSENAVEIKQEITSKKVKGNKDNAKSVSKDEVKTAKQAKKVKIDTEVLAKAKEQMGQKQKKMKETGVKLPENFIKIAENETDDDEDDDSSINFDSDEFDKLQDDVDEFDTGSSDDDEAIITGDEDESDQDDEAESSMEDLPQVKAPLKRKADARPVPLVLAPKNKKTSKVVKQKMPPAPAPIKTKQKFEKKVKPTKQFKKK